VTVPLGRTVSTVAALAGRAGMTGRTAARLTAGQAIARPERAAVVTAGPAGHVGLTRRLVTARAGRTAGDMTMAVAADGGGAVTTAGPGRARRAGAGRGLVTPGLPGPVAGPVLADPVLAGTALGPVAGRAGPEAAGLAAKRPGRAGRGPAARLARPGLFPTYRRALPQTSSTRRPGRSCARCPATWPRRWPGS
jgi:hypothetical protein